VQARASQHHVEVHTEDTGRRVVFEAKIDVLGDTEPEAATAWKYI